jgi:hypothetical protein
VDGEKLCGGVSTALPQASEPDRSAWLRDNSSFVGLGLPGPRQSDPGLSRGVRVGRAKSFPAPPRPAVHSQVVYLGSIARLWLARGGAGTGGPTPGRILGYARFPGPAEPPAWGGGPRACVLCVHVCVCSRATRRTPLSTGAIGPLGVLEAGGAVVAWGPCARRSYCPALLRWV